MKVELWDFSTGVIIGIFCGVMIALMIFSYVNSLKPQFPITTTTLGGLPVLAEDIATTLTVEGMASSTTTSTVTTTTRKQASNTTIASNTTSSTTISSTTTTTLASGDAYGCPVNLNAFSSIPLHPVQQVNVYNYSYYLSVDDLYPVKLPTGWTFEFSGAVYDYNCHFGAPGSQENSSNLYCALPFIKHTDSKGYSSDYVLKGVFDYVSSGKFSYNHTIWTEGLGNQVCG